MDNSISENIAHLTLGMVLMFFLYMIYNLYSLQKQNRLLKFLFYESILFFFIELKELIYVHTPNWSNPFLSKVCFTIDLLIVPATMIFLFELLSPNWVTRKKAFYIVGPFLLLQLLFIISQQVIIYNSLIVLSVVCGLITLIMVYYFSSKYDKIIKLNYSNVENLSIKWVRLIIILLFGYLLVWVLLQKNNNWWSDSFYYILTVVLWWFIYHFSIKHIIIEMPVLFDYFKVSESTCCNNDTKGFKKDFNGSMEQLMIDEKLYLDPHLTIQDLAAKIGTNRTYLSCYLNNELNTTFYQYINSQRIDYAAKLLNENRTISIEEVASMCGFNSVSTFRRAFKVAKHTTPLNFRNKQSQ